MTERVRVRFAPSPAGIIGFANAHAALFNWLFARHNQGSFILRLADIGAAAGPEAYSGIYISLKWLGLDWDEGPVGREKFTDPGAGDFGPYLQSERHDVYARHLDDLRDKGLAYPCFCSSEDLEAERRNLARRGLPPAYSGTCARTPEDEAGRRINAGEAHAWRLRTGQAAVTWQDVIRGRMVAGALQAGDPVIFHQSGQASACFADAVDDRLMQITHVIRAHDGMADTAGQVLILRAFGWDAPAFAHLPMITAPDNKPLDGRRGSHSLDDLYRRGYLPEAIINALVLLGWSSPSGEEIMDRETMAEEFTLERMNKSPAAFDPARLDWINGKHLRALPGPRLVQAVKPYLQHAGMTAGRDDQWIERALETVRDRLGTCVDAIEEMKVYLFEPEEMDEEAEKWMREPAAPEIIRAVREGVVAAVNLDAETARQIIKSAGKEAGVKGRALYMPVRAALSGRAHGPALFEMIEVLGKEEVESRLAKALENLP